MFYRCPWSPLHHIKPALSSVAPVLQNQNHCEGRLDHQTSASQHLPVDTGNQPPTVGSPVSALELDLLNQFVSKARHRDVRSPFENLEWGDPGGCSCSPVAAQRRARCICLRLLPGFVHLPFIWQSAGEKAAWKWNRKVGKWGQRLDRGRGTEQRRAVRECAER